MREVMETYKPHILSRRRQLIEDCVRDLRLNNDHIHIIEQEMRRSIQQGLSKTEHDSSRFVFFWLQLSCFEISRHLILAFDWGNLTSPTFLLHYWAMCTYLAKFTCLTYGSISTLRTTHL